MSKEIRICWWSAGITSAVAGKASQELYENVQFYYIETGRAHPDNVRFKGDCEKWYNQEIITVQNRKGYKDHIDVILKERYVNGPEGAKCTKELKKEVRADIEELYKPTLFNQTLLVNQIFGFEFEKKEVNRAIRFLEQYPSAKALFPLVEKGLTKDNCAGILMNQGIELPVMYKLGFNNNNCIGCVKGGMAYWNKIRTHFPDDFNKMAAAERNVGRSCIQDVFLDELDPNAGRKDKPITPNCGTFCEVDFADIPHKSLDSIMDGVVSIYEVIKKVA
jgi:hypothetical protein